MLPGFFHLQHKLFTLQKNQPFEKPIAEFFDKEKHLILLLFD